MQWGPTDHVEPILMALIPKSEREHDSDKFVRHLIGRNPILQSNPFKVDKAEPQPDGFLYHFRTCQKVVALVVKKQFTLPLPQSNIKFEECILRGLPSVGYTKELSLPTQPTPPTENDSSEEDYADPSGQHLQLPRKETPRFIFPPLLGPTMAVDPPPPPPPLEGQDRNVTRRSKK
jgi:hypothetical protein